MGHSIKYGVPVVNSKASFSIGFTLQKRKLNHLLLRNLNDENDRKDWTKKLRSLWFSILNFHLTEHSATTSTAQPTICSELLLSLNQTQENNRETAKFHKAEILNVIVFHNLEFTQLFIRYSAN